MEIGIARVKLGDEIKNQVNRHDVTPAEVLVLQHIHGHGSVMHVTPTKTARRSIPEEIGRLRARYVSKNAATAVNELFPGATPNIPTKFSEVQVDINPLFDDAPLPKPKKEAKKEPASELDQKLKEIAEAEEGAEAEKETEEA